MKFQELIRKISLGFLLGDIHSSFEGLSSDSRSIKRGDLFFALKGTHFDGHSYIKEVLKKDIAGIVLDIRKVSQFRNLISQNKDIVWLGVDDTKKSLGEISMNFYNIDSSDFFLIGITGTNGKTTVSFLIESILKEWGKSSLRIGTLGFRLTSKETRREIKKSLLTTPQAPQFFRLLREAKDRGVEYIILEASSQGLKEQRLYPLEFDRAIFTNLSRDHLDYHHTFEDYFQAKRILFERLKKGGISIINKDDFYGRRLLYNISGLRILFSLKSKDAHIHLLSSKYKNLSQEAKFSTPLGVMAVKTTLLGEHNLSNILAAIGLGLSLDIDAETIKRGIEKVRFIPGRLQSVVSKDRVGFIDYAHTPRALFKVLLTLRKMGFHEIITVFGCGGERDRRKRPQMARIASLYSSRIIITDDNPRGEEPTRIIKDILKGLKKREVIIERDRHQAIKKAVSLSSKGSAILIAGKGHERYQIVGKKRIPFSDLFYLKRYLKNRN